jgi:hypothetical protein
MKANTAQQDERPMPEIRAGYWDQVMDILAWACLTDARACPPDRQKSNRRREVMIVLD